MDIDLQAVEVSKLSLLLKVLEEPPTNTIIIILVTSLDFILPTILSRCNLINLDRTRKLSDEEIQNNLKIIHDLKNNGASQSLLIAQNNSKDRETALAFLEGLIISLHTELKSDNLQILKALQKTYTIIKTTNVAPRFALENLFLRLF